MKENVLKFILNYIKIYLFGGLSSLLLLIYLVISDPYFHQLDFKLEGFKIKIEEYLLFTFNIPIILIVLFSLILIVRNRSKKSKLIVFLCSLANIYTFIAVDTIIKKNLLYHKNILLGLIISFFIYCLLFFITLKNERKLNLE